MDISEVAQLSYYFRNQMPNARNFQRQLLRRFEIWLVIIYTVKAVGNVKTFLDLSPVSRVMTICILLH